MLYSCTTFPFSITCLTWHAAGCFCEVGQCQKHFCDIQDFTPYPAISRWLKACEELPGFAESHEMLTKMAPRFAKMIAQSKL